MIVEKRTYKEDQKISDSIARCKCECDHCGHKEIMVHVDRKICSWCGHWVYRDAKAKFKYKIKEMMKNEK